MTYEKFNNNQERGIEKFKCIQNDCQQELPRKNFYKYNNTVIPICKNCVNKIINPNGSFDFDNFKDFLNYRDVPFDEKSFSLAVVHMSEKNCFNFGEYMKYLRIKTLPNLYLNKDNDEYKIHYDIARNGFKDKETGLIKYKISLMASKELFTYEKSNNNNSEKTLVIDIDKIVNDELNIISKLSYKHDRDMIYYFTGNTKVITLETINPFNLERCENYIRELIKEINKMNKIYELANQYK